MKQAEMKRLIYEWNNTCPVDRWWRKKHGIAFASPAHRASSFIEMYFEYLEDKLFLEASTLKEEVKDWIKPHVATEAEYDKMFEEMNLDDFDKLEM